MPKKIHKLDYHDFCPKCSEPFGDMLCGRSDEEEELESTLVDAEVTCKNCLRKLKPKDFRSEFKK